LELKAALQMLAAGAFHASWHAIAKVGSSLAILAGMGAVSSVIAIPFLLIVPTPVPSVWAIITISVCLHGAYKLSLSQAYSSADFSNAYPMARGFVPLFAAILSYVWLGQAPSVGQSAAIICISCGVLGLATQWSSFRAKTILATAAAGVTVAAYSIVDAWGIRASGNWGSFTIWLVISDSAAFLAIARIIQGPTLWKECAQSAKPIAVASLLGLTAFTVFLWALSSNSAASVIAFRECSVLFGAIISLAALKEVISFRKLSCVSLIAGGLIAIAFLK
jgi:drug/metabolite transporter (DMT)-like permease